MQYILTNCNQDLTSAGQTDFNPWGTSYWCWILWQRVSLSSKLKNKKCPLNEGYLPIINLIQTHLSVSFIQFPSGISVVHPMHVPTHKSFLSIIGLKQHIITLSKTDHVTIWCITLIQLFWSKICTVQIHYIVNIAKICKKCTHCNVYSWDMMLQYIYNIVHY